MKRALKREVWCRVAAGEDLLVERFLVKMLLVDR